MNLITFIFVEFFALCLEGFFSGSEIALISSDRLALKKKSDKGDSGSRLALKLLKHPENVLVTTLIGTNLCVAFQATFATLYIYKNFGPNYDIYTTLILSPLVLIFGEILPKTIFQRYAETMASKAAFFIQAARLIFTPMSWILNKYTNFLSQNIQPVEEMISSKQSSSHRDELRYLLSYGQKETTLKTSERRMIRRILDFSKVEARNAQIPLIQLDMAKDNISVRDALEAFKRSKHSRLPVYHDRVDNVVGILHLYDLFGEKNLDRPISQIMQPTFYAPETQLLQDLLFTMQIRGIRMAIVVDEYGGATGVLTVEDIVEEIVGDIKDEYDPDTSQYKEIQEGVYLIHARMEINAANEQLKLGLPRGNYETIAGFLLQQFNRIPEEGDELYYKNLKFVIRKASNRAVLLVQVAFLIE